MIAAGYIGALLMGVVLGLLGGGGSILTVPILVYLFHVDTVLATAYSLFVVGTTALVAGASHLRMGNVDRRAALLFGGPGVLGVILMRRWIVPALPDPLLATHGLTLSRSAALLILLAILMVLAAWNMLRPRPAVAVDAPADERPVNATLLMVRGFLTGLLTSLVGAGGGFLIVPALAAFARLHMHRAIGTSLLVIAAGGLIGAGIDPDLRQAADLPFLLTVTGVAVAGSLAGSRLNRHLPNRYLRPAFGWLVLVLGTFILTRELLHA